MSNPTDIDSLIDNEEQYNDNSSATTFDLTVIHTKRHVLHNISPDHKISTVKDLIKNEILNTDKQIDLHANGVTLKDDKTMSFYKFPKISARANKVDVVFNAPGGSDKKNDKKNDEKTDEKKSDIKPTRIRKLDFAKFADLKKTDADDCIYGAMKDVICAQMSCGCSFAPQTMYDYIKSIFDKYQTAYKITCPFHKNVEWDWDYITEVADMTDDEYYDWCRIRDKRKYNNFKECPNCKNLCKRKENVLIFCMACENCNGPHWCWECTQRWKGSGTIICGNKNCTLVTLINEELAAAPMIQPKWFSKKVPVIRACPRCMTRMKWLDNCKHLKCEGCGHWFCFSCLGVGKTNAKYPCDGVNGCEVKTVQQFGINC